MLSMCKCVGTLRTFAVQRQILFYLRISLNPLPDNKILDGSTLRQSADKNFEFDENSRKFSKRLENTVDKGEIARYEQFLLFPQCFQKACFPGASKGVIMWEWVKINQLQLSAATWDFSLF